ncbi:MAG: outer membrane beta-barrel protein [Bradyrhizobium sp.]|nr:outer membrane beta-barrel protein [Bradyrhizobium sp.]
MKKILLATVAVVVLGATVPALAADLRAPQRYYTKAPAYVAPIYNWTGFYIGGHLGGGFGGDNSILGSGRFLGGIQGGADYQFAPNWVAGVEAQYSWTSSNHNSLTFPGGVVVTSNSDQLGSVTGRLGYTFGPTLLYAKGGYAWKDGDNLAAAVGGVPVAFAATGNHRDGYTVGGGLEYMFAPNWSAKLEYMYYNFGTTTIVTAPAAAIGQRFNDDEHVVKAGVNYRFNWGGPVAGRY